MEVHPCISKQAVDLPKTVRIRSLEKGTVLLVSCAWPMRVPPYANCGRSPDGPFSHRGFKLLLVTGAFAPGRDISSNACSLGLYSRLQLDTFMVALERFVTDHQHVGHGVSPGGHAA